EFPDRGRPDQGLHVHPGPQRGGAARSGWELHRAARPLRVRQDDAAAAHRRLRRPRFRHDRPGRPHRGRRRSQRGRPQSRDRLRAPGGRAVPASHRGGQHQLRVAAAAAERRWQGARAARPGGSGRRPGGPVPAPALRRPAAAGGARPGPRARAVAGAARRAVLLPGRRPARGDPRGGLPGPHRIWRHHRPGDPRPGRGALDGRPGRGAPWRAARTAHRSAHALPAARGPRRRRLRRRGRRPGRRAPRRPRALPPRRAAVRADRRGRRRRGAGPRAAAPGAAPAVGARPGRRGGPGAQRGLLRSRLAGVAGPGGWPDRHGPAGRRRPAQRRRRRLHHRARHRAGLPRSAPHPGGGRRTTGL
ncbi:MAG: Ferric iron ABC transporter, ATP-binding protein, partial [uncultured Blastococcus sp.]